MRWISTWLLELIMEIVNHVTDRFKTQEMSDKAVDTCPFVLDSAPDRYITQQFCDKVVSEDPCVKYSHDIRLNKCVIKSLILAC